MRLLIAGIQWPPEPFLMRLIDGLAQAGVSVTVGTAVRPAGSSTHVEWLSTPAWEGGVLRRLLRLADSAVRATAGGTGDLRVLRRSPHCGGASSWGVRLRVWNRLLPYAGRRWDIIYFPWNSAAIAHLPVFDLGVPVVVSCRGAQVSVAPHHPERVELRAGLRDTFARAAAVHCVSEATFREAAAFGLERAKTWVIHPAVDPDVFRPRVTGPARDEVFRVITTGSLIWRKGGEWALSAIRLLRDYGVPVQLDMLGEGPDRQRLLYTRRDLGLEEVVRFPGRLEPAAVLAELQQADVFLLSSLSEGLANSVLEAMACGIPVVTTDCGGMREAVTDGVEGFVTPVRNAEALARAMLRLARDRDLRERMGWAGRARILREFGLARQIGQWLALFHSVLSRGKVAADETCVDLERPSDVPTCVNG